MVTFEELSWAALLSHYKFNGDKRYIKLMADKSFICRLRTSPSDVVPEELEQKIILDHVNIINYDLLMGCRLAEKILQKIVRVQPEVRVLESYSITNVDPWDPTIVECIQTIYRELSQVNGLWLTGVSKIAHVLNDQLLPIMGLDVIDRFPEIKENGFMGVTPWLKHIHEDAKAVVIHFEQKHYPGSAESYLSDNLGYTAKGVTKSLIKFLDEYYWIRYGEQLPIPPTWVPDKQVGN